MLYATHKGLVDSCDEIARGDRSILDRMER